MQEWAEAPPSDALWNRITQELNITLERPRPRRSLLPQEAIVAMTTGAVLLLGIATMAPAQEWLGWRVPMERTIGPFKVRGDFYGRMEYYDATGKLLQVEDTKEASGTRNGTYGIEGSGPGKIVSVTGNGRTSIYSLVDDSTDQLLSKLVLRRQLEPMTESPLLHPPTDRAMPGTYLERAWEWQTSLWKTGTASIEESPLGVTGYDWSRGLVWSMCGVANVRVQPMEPGARTQSGGTTHGRRELGEAIAKFTKHGPQFECVYRGLRGKFRSFGTYTLYDSGGRPALVVTIEPVK